MALFFDQEWFDGRLTSIGKTRDSLAMSAGMTADEIDMVFDDRRQVSVSEIHDFAKFFNVEPDTIAFYCGVGDLELEVAREQNAGQGASTGDVMLSREALAGLHERIDRLERLLEMVLTGLEVRR
ncbi:MAG: hypothetical protein CME88_05125 [Hirschia sp.]|nr:hypothetical protein [Hirschia sp.]MBF17745.1 hypothetical protein [Hirschia sp.]|tara:strand:- start:60 stop:434 length:375 start_codon:yes stop_codon:yes gene_type:complete